MSAPTSIPSPGLHLRRSRICTGNRNRDERRRLFAAARRRVRLGLRQPSGIGRTATARGTRIASTRLATSNDPIQALRSVQAELRRLLADRRQATDIGHASVTATLRLHRFPRMSLLNLLSSLVNPAPRVQPSAYAQQIRTGQALLVDVREPAEWARGVAESATLLPLSDLRGDRKLWRAFLAAAGPKEILLYCASGMRSASAAQLLQSEGFRAVNAGALGDWAAAGWLIVSPKRR